MGLGTRIADARTRAGFTQTELAEAVGRSVHAVRKWEQGKNQPSLEKLEEIARVTHCSLAFLVGIEENNISENHGVEAISRQVRQTIKHLEENDVHISPPLDRTPVHPGVETLARDEHVCEMYGVTESEINALRTCMIGRPDGSFVVIETIQEALRVLETLRSLAHSDRQ